MCLICERIEMIKQDKNKFFVEDLETGYVVLGDAQHFKGYTLFLYKDHVHELSELDQIEKIKFLAEMAAVGEAVANTFDCEKMNYELLGNGDPHLHWHLFPRVQGDLENYGHHGKGPVWWYPREKMYSPENKVSDEELTQMKINLRNEIKNILRM